jgi:hypothetical protein
MDSYAGTAPSAGRDEARNWVDAAAWKEAVPVAEAVKELEALRAGRKEKP